jgi:hypothetical protein
MWLLIKMPNTALNTIELANAVVGCDGLSSEQAEEMKQNIDTKTIKR